MADITSSLEVKFGELGAGIVAGTQLLLTYENEDNPKPSATARSQAGDCNAPELTDAQKEQLCAADAIAWTTRKLRLYPAVLATLVTTHGTVKSNGVRQDSRTQVLAFNGSAEGTLSFPATSVTIDYSNSHFWDTDGTKVSVTATHVGDGVMKLSEAAYGVLAVQYDLDYLEVELQVLDPPTVGEGTEATVKEFDVGVSAFHEGKVATTNVRFTPEDCDGGLSSGKVCITEIIKDIIDDQSTLNWTAHTNWDDLIKAITPPYFVLSSMNHPAEGKKDEPFTVRMTIREVNGVDGQGIATFSSGAGSNSAAFTVDANGSTTVSFSVTPDSGGYFNTTGDVGDFFSRKHSTISINDPEEDLPTEWNELERTMSEVEVGTEPNTVTIKRIEDVVFESPTGARMKLIFDNTDVDP